MPTSSFLFITCYLSLVGALNAQENANPIRKIVTLLQDMQNEITAEGKKEEEAFDKFMCYCDGNTDGMKKSVEDGKQMVVELSSKLESMKAEKSRIDQELQGHQDSRANAKQDANKAASIREKEHSDFEAESTDLRSNIDASAKAIAALEKGAGAFLQMGSSDMARIQHMAMATSTVDDFERETLLGFLQGKQDYAPQSGQITGMVKAMKDEMESDLKTAISNEEQAVAGFEQLSAAKSAEIQSATEAIEAKTRRSGELAVEIVQTADAVEDGEKEIAETEGFLGDLGKQCASKKAEWGERQSTRAEEISAIGQAIAVLNDDDALDLFKKTVPSFSQTSMGLGFLQKKVAESKVLRAQHLLLSLAQTGKSHQTQLSLIASALKSKAVDFSKIVTMIDDMVACLKKQQEDDDAQKAFCDDEFSKTAQQKKDTEDKLASLAAHIDEMNATVESLSSEIATLQEEIKSLDKAVAEATTLRKSDHEIFVTAQAENQAATQLVEKAKNKLNKFYRPNLYKAPPQRELTDEEKILAASGRSDMIATEAPEYIPGTTQTVYVQVREVAGAAPPPPPETFGAYQKKDGKSNGVMALMDMMIKDLKKDHTEAEHAEETAQADYERLMRESQATREQNAKSITEKESDKADWSAKIEAANEDSTSTTASLMKLNEYIAELHGNCDFLVQNHGMRKEARTSEIDGLANAKAVLSGASFE